MKREQRALLRRQQSLVELEENLVDEQLPDAIEDAQFSTEVANVSMSQVSTVLFCFLFCLLFCFLPEIS